MSEPLKMICVRFSCFHPLWPGFFYFGLVVASLMRYRLLPEWFGVSPPPPNPHRQVGLEGGRKRQQWGKSRDGRLAELDHCQVGGGWALPTPPPPLVASVLWVQGLVSQVSHRCCLP